MASNHRGGDSTRTPRGVGATSWVVSQNGWFIMRENPYENGMIWGYHYFLETPVELGHFLKRAHFAKTILVRILYLPFLFEQTFVGAITC